MGDGNRPNVWVQWLFLLLLTGLAGTGSVEAGSISSASAGARSVGGNSIGAALVGAKDGVKLEPPATPIPASPTSPSSPKSPPVIKIPPAISSLLKPSLWKRALDDKEILVNANLREGEPPTESMQEYTFYAAMVVGASLPQTRKVLTDYQLYSEMIPYISQTEYFPDLKKLYLEGGVWNYRLKSQIVFHEKSDRWVHFKIVQGHFSGLIGDFFFESLGEKGTAVYIRGEQLGSHWPPRFVIERGAEIVFEFTAKRMRSYIESQKKGERGASHESNRSEIPQPRSYLKSDF